LIFRTATSEDRLQLANLRWAHENDLRDLHGYDKDKFLEEFCRFLDSTDGQRFTIWVAEDKGRIVSNVFLLLIRKVPKPHRLYSQIGYITNVQTVTEYRNQGIGTLLMKHIQEWAKEQSVELLFLWPSQRAVPFYVRLGFTQKNEIMECVFE